MNYNLLAIDPGVTTGIAHIRGRVDNLWINSTQIRADEYPHPHMAIFDTLSNINPSCIVYEPFHFRQGKLGMNTTGVEYIGVIEYYAQNYKKQIFKVNPGDGKGFWKDNKIKALGMWTPGKPHGIDALRIALTHIMKTDSEFSKIVLEELKDL